MFINLPDAFLKYVSLGESVVKEFVFDSVKFVPFLVTKSGNRNKDNQQASQLDYWQICI